MEQRFKRVRKQLDDLGYMQVLIPESLPLVEKLTADLIQTTESLQKYKKIAKNAAEERDSLQLGAEPYKCDNAKLVKECNDLHLAFLQFREQNEKSQKDFKRRISTLEKEKFESESACEKLRKRIRELESESAKKTDRILAFQNKNLQAGNKTTTKSNLTSVSKSRTSTASKSNTEISTTMALADQKIANLTKEIKKLRDDQLQLSEMNETYKNQLNNRDREIDRLNKMLEGGRPIQALNQDCCYKDVDAKLYLMQKEICSLEKEKSEMEVRVKEAVSKQHEAMKRALHLADRNKQLQQELRDIDQMALAVEAGCNTTVKINAEKVSRLQETVHDTVLKIQTLERDVTELKRDKQELLSDLEALKLEKKHLQSLLETALDEKKRLNDRINQFTVIEHDLNLEIDRLVQTSANQKRKIAELECKLLAGKFEAITERSGVPEENQYLDSSPNRLPKNSYPGNSPIRKPRKKSRKPPATSQISKELCDYSGNLLIATEMQGQQNKSYKGLPSSFPPKTNKTCKKKSTSHAPKSKPTKPNKRFSSVPKNSPNDSFILTGDSESDSVDRSFNNDKAAKRYGGTYACCHCCNNGWCMQSVNKPRLKAGVDCPCMQATSSIEHFKTERDYYMKEYHRLLEQMKNIPSKPDSHGELLQKLNEREQFIATLQHDNKTLAQEKHNLMTRLETARDRAEGDYDSLSMKSTVRRLERERDMFKGDIIRLEEERDAIRQRLKIATETQIVEHARLEKTLMESEEQVRRLEQERRDLMQCQGSRRATISGLEEQCETLKEQLQMCQTELNHQRALYTQLKTLHEQTDKALGDSQGQLNQVESELEKSQERVRSLEKDRSQLDQEVATLKNDIMVMRGNVAQIDQEKDGLLISVDDKTERLAMLEQELRAKEDKLLTLETTVTELKKKLSMNIDSSSSREQLLRSASAESASLRQELDAALRAKDNAHHENRRIQDDLATTTADCRCARNELELCKRQIEDLKRQLQHYVSEVKRFEDLMSHKEVERNELLDQFRSLSQEATMLENNNHTLENEAAQSKVQLSVTLGHVADLETKLNGQDDMISGYEQQITDLTSQIANLESQLCHYRQQQERTEADLVSVRDLCMKLDKQKDSLARELNEKEEQRSQVDRDVLRMRRESETLQSSLVKDRNSIESLETLLADARQEAVQQRLYNQELEAEIQTLKERIEDFQSRLSPAPATATFTYSASLGGTYDNKLCTCCANCLGNNLNDKGDIIDTSSAVITGTSKKNECCGKCSGKSQPKRQSGVNESKMPDWKQVIPPGDKFKRLLKNNSCNSSCSAHCAKYVVGDSKHIQPSYSLSGDETSYKMKNMKAPTHSFFGSTTGERAQMSSYVSPPLKSASVEPSLTSDTLKSNQNCYERSNCACKNCCGIQKCNISESDNKFGSVRSKILEADNANVKCSCTTSFPAPSTYTAHYSFARNK